MKFTSFKDYIVSRWKMILLINFVIVIYISIFNNRIAYFHIPSFARKIHGKGLITSEGRLTDTTVVVKNPLYRHLSMHKASFRSPKGSHVITTAYTLPTNTTQPFKESHPNISRVDSMGKYLLQGVLQSINNNTDTYPMASQQRDYKLLISANETCKPARNYANNSKPTYENTFDFSRKIFLLMTVKSLCRSWDRRQAIRSSWGNESWIYENLGVRVKVIFLLGDCNSEKDKEKLDAEILRYSDILQWNFYDSFQHLTIKECLFLQWYTDHCQNVAFLYQGDDDVLVNVENILYYLSSLPGGSEKTIWAGSLLKGSPRITNPKSKYYVSKKLFPGKVYPPYLSGGGNVLSGSVAVRFFKESLHTPMIPIDDAFLGILAKSIGIEPQNVDGFQSWGMDDPSPQNLASIKTYHRVSPKKMVSMWKSMIAVNGTAKFL